MIGWALWLAPLACARDLHGDLKLPARDGTELYTVWSAPEGAGPFPTVVTRVPYPMDPILDWQCDELRERGYACVYQHVRGRGRSAGEWVPFVHEEQDGEDLVAWIQAQPWSNGQVAWIGDSYLAATGWTVIPGDPSGVSAMISRVFAPSLYGTTYEDGLLRHELVTAWMSMMPDSDAPILAGPSYHKALKHRPRATMDEVAAGHPVPWFRDWLTAEDPSAPYWSTEQPARFGVAVAHTTIPVMFVGGWSDVFIEAQVAAWAQLPDRSQSLFVIGPWDHLGNRPSDITLKNLDPPMTAGGGMAQLSRAMGWLDMRLKGAPVDPALTGVISYVIGGDRWEHYPDWPPPTTERRFQAIPGQGRCDGQLREGAPGEVEARHYNYDPENPLPSRGGAGLLAGVVPMMNGVPPGFIRSPVRCEKRDDVLSYRSEPLQAAMHLTGAPVVELEVASDAPDTAFGFRLLAQPPGQPEVILREGFATLALRDGAPRQPYTPGERVTVRPDGAPMDVELQPGTTLSLALTSSSFPAYEAHPNQAGLLSEATETRVAKQTVYRATLVLPEMSATTTSDAELAP